MYSSLHSGLFEGYDMVLYEPVMQVKDFHYRTLILIGESKLKSNVRVRVAEREELLCNTIDNIDSVTRIGNLSVFCTG